MKKLKNCLSFIVGTALILCSFMTHAAFAAGDNRTSGDVTVTTYYPAPFGNYKDVKVKNTDESDRIEDFTQGLIKAGINIIVEYPASGAAYTSGVFWSTLVNNPGDPKAGIWMLENTNESRLYFGTSGAFASGITKTMVLDKNGSLGVGLTAAATAPGVAPTNLPTVNTVLDVNGVGAHDWGTSAAPSFAIRNDLGTGMWSKAPGTLNFSTAASERMEITSQGNVGIGPFGAGGEVYNPGSAPLNGDNANLDVNDVWLRNGAKWAGSMGIAGVGPTSGAPDASGSYTGGTGGNSRLIATSFAPMHVIVWVRNGASIEMSETWKGLIFPAAAAPDGSATTAANCSFHYAADTDVRQTYLRIPADQTSPGFYVGGTTLLDQTNETGSIYYWYAWD